VLYQEKLSKHLVRELISLGVAEPVYRPREPSPRRTFDRPVEMSRLLVTSSVQTCVIGVLARHIANRENRLSGCTAQTALHPHTDQYLAFASAHEPEPYRPSQQCWRIEIGGLLPVPANDVMLSDVIAFRNRYEDERRRLMLALDRLLHGLRQQYEHPSDVLRLVRADLESAVADLQAAQTSARMAWVKRSISAMVAFGTAGTAATAGLPSGWSATLGVVGGIAVNVATSEIRQSSGLRRRDYSYLHRLVDIL
jgi:hypothetical protein